MNKDTAFLSDSRRPLRIAIAVTVLVAGLLSLGTARAAQYSFTATGTFFDGFLANTGDFGPTTDNVYLPDGDPVLTPLDFTLTFIVDDAAPFGGNPTVDGSRYDGAVTNISVIADGLPFLSQPVEDVFHFINGPVAAPSNHQWSVFSGGTLDNASDFLEVRDVDTDDTVDELSFAQGSLFLLDFDAALFAETPPQLTIPTGSEFESMTFELVWLSLGPDLYEYTLIGEINTLDVQVVPLPPALLLLAPALMPLLLRRRRV